MGRSQYHHQDTKRNAEPLGLSLRVEITTTGVWA